MVVAYPVNKINAYFVSISMIIFFALLFVLCPISSLYAGRYDKRALKNTSTGTGIKDETKGIEGGGVLFDNSSVSEKGHSTNGEGRDKDEKDKASLKKDTGLYDYSIPSAEEESYGWLIFKTILILAAIVGGFYFFFRFVTKRAGVPAVGRGIIQILSIVPIGQNKFLQIVDLAGRMLVLGVSDSNINLIMEIDDRDEVDRIRLLCSKSSSMKSGGFQESISKHLGRLMGKSPEPGIGEEQISALMGDKNNNRLDYLAKQKDRLKNLNSEE